MRALIYLFLALGAIARAGTVYTETTDFSGTPTTPFLLPVGTSQVNGSVGGTDEVDFFEFMGLAGGSPFTLVVQNINLSEIATEVLSDTQTVLVGPTVLSAAIVTVLTGTVPLDGNLEVGIAEIIAQGGGQQPQGVGSSGQNPTELYSVTLAPEPGTLGILGLGLGVLFYQRTRSKASTKKNSPHMTDSSTPNPLWT
jgi:hypothetical protein